MKHEKGPLEGLLEKGYLYTAHYNDDENEAEVNSNKATIRSYYEGTLNETIPKTLKGTTQKILKKDGEIKDLNLQEGRRLGYQSSYLLTCRP